MRPFPRPLPYLMVFWFLAGCIGLSWDTTVANTAETRLALAQSVEIGRTTERGLVTRWGNPLQKVHEGGQSEYIYRQMNGDSADYVIVTFQHGLATGVRWSEIGGCRATFAPRVPGYGYDTPDIVRPVGACAPAARPGVVVDAYGRVAQGQGGSGTRPVGASDGMASGVPEGMGSGSGTSGGVGPPLDATGGKWVRLPARPAE
ncbi:MAG: hypothetical protein HKO95_09265 [Rhodobacteraceae bacterium]|nr:hypothetical protein [Alphaproteobacteria bacterium]NNK66914.1 hypothetical protein [Paracoccaceae bacterium]